jgi:hypothetical protein
LGNIYKGEDNRKQQMFFRQASMSMSAKILASVDTFHVHENELELSNNGSIVTAFRTAE